MKYLLSLLLLGVFLIPESDAGQIFVNTPGATIAVGGRVVPIFPSIVQDGLGNQFLFANTFGPQLSFFSGPVVGPAVIAAGLRAPRVDVIERRGIFGNRVTRTRIFP